MGVQINGSEGNVVATKGTYSGNVTIGGTLTYEDVTNIDSVGIITARSGIEIGASPGVGASISVDGNAIFSGITTAATLKATTGIVTTLTATTGIVTSLIANTARATTGIVTTLTATTGIVTTFVTNTAKVGAAVTISESGIEASGIGITCANINGTQIGGRRNISINGACEVAQRGTSSTTYGYGSVDRYAVYFQGHEEAVTHSQADVSSGTSPYSEGFRKCLKLTNGNQSGGADVNSFVQIQHKYEAQDIAKSGWNYTSSSSFITVQFWVKASVAQTYYAYLRSYDGTGQRYYWSFALSADTWTKVIKTIPGNSNLQFDNDTNQGFHINWGIFYGTDMTASGTTAETWAAYASGTRVPDMTSTWYTTNDATFEVTGVQMEVGPQATAFEHRNFGDELALCQRYFFKWVSSVAYSNFAIGYTNSSTGVETTYQLPVIMRGTPTLATSGTFRIVGYNSSGQSVSTLSSIEVTRSHTRSPYLRATVSGVTIGQIGEWGDNGSNDATMSFDAEI